eukprot:CAMPEP_0115126762 /NCGR_PEP_ID=MMETSP0227-20121206/49960_1 /TAXON_ID=89957 /ORGANISM="Polarella glacialis, Strain CCMP 1383" /LENGTH=116 /DNA_ID=CAMNT_0002530645 /DNA_START=244 /DNA_END=591 /DNA_ORIENTATION=+
MQHFYLAALHLQGLGFDRLLYISEVARKAREGATCHQKPHLVSSPETLGRRRKNKLGHHRIASIGDLTRRAMSDERQSPGGSENDLKALVAEDCVANVVAETGGVYITKPGEDVKV